MGLADWGKRKMNELSKGMQQKAQFIATVLHQPDILILDEPMSGLDPVGMNLMRDVLLDLRRAGTTLVLSSHQMEAVERLCDRVALIHKGRKILDGPGLRSEARPRHQHPGPGLRRRRRLSPRPARGHGDERLRPLRRAAAPGRRRPPGRAREARPACG